MDVNKKLNHPNITFTHKENNFFSRLNNSIIWFSKLGIKEKVVFYRLLSTMINADLQILKSIQILEKQEKNPLLKKILWVFCEELKQWKNISQCLEMYPQSFSREEIWMIKSWEKTGKLNDALNNIASNMEKVSSTSRKIKWAMVYPFFIILIVFGVIITMMTVVVPKLLDIFENKDLLPLSTKFLIFTSDFVSSYWIFIILFFIIFYFAVIIFKKTPKWLYLFDNFLLSIPIFWDINRKFILSKFSRVFSGLISSWVSVVESLLISANTVWNDVYRQRILLLSEDVKKWIKIWESLETDKLFPEMMVQMIQVGEQVAKLDKTIVKVADFYDEQVDNTVSTLNKLLEPMIIVFLALIVWFIAIAIMQPIINMADFITE